MSIKMISQVVKLRLSPAQKLVALMIAYHANDEGGSAFPSVATLCEETGLGRRTVFRAIEQLRAAEILIPEGKTKYRTISYAMVPERHGCQSDTSKVPERHSNGATAAPNPSGKRQRTVSAPRAGRETWLTPFLTAWKDRVGGELKAGKAAAFLAPLVKTHGADEVLQAWTLYLGRTEPERCSPGRFSETYGVWTPSRPRAKLEPVDEEYRRRHREQMAKANGTAGAA